MSEDENKGQGDQFMEFTQNLVDSVREVFRRSADEVVAGAKVTRARIDVFQLRRDRDHFLMRLGEEAYRLIEAGQLSHPELDESAGRVRTIDDKVREFEADITGDIEADASAAPEPEPEPKKKAAKKAAKKKAEPKKKAAKKTEPKKKAAKKAEPKKKAAKTTKKSGGKSKKSL
jgi:outer membrane biosynthesis protein TonB